MKLFTIGYGGAVPQAFTDRLRKAGVQTVVDVRLRPDQRSMIACVKAKAPEKGIEGLLGEASIGYLSFLSLATCSWIMMTGVNGTRRCLRVRATCWCRGWQTWPGLFACYALNTAPRSAIEC